MGPCSRCGTATILMAEANHPVARRVNPLRGSAAAFRGRERKNDQSVHCCSPRQREHVQRVPSLRLVDFRELRGEPAGAIRCML